MSAPRVLVAAATLATLGAFIWRADNYQLYVLALVGLAAIVGVGLNVLVGLSGQISLVTWHSTPSAPMWSAS